MLVDTVTIATATFWLDSSTIDCCWLAHRAADVSAANVIDVSGAASNGICGAGGAAVAIAAAVHIAAATFWSDDSTIDCCQSSPHAAADVSAGNVIDVSGAILNGLCGATAGVPATGAFHPFIMSLYGP